MCACTHFVGRFERIMVSVLDFDILDTHDELGGAVLYLRCE